MTDPFQAGRDHHKSGGYYEELNNEDAKRTWREEEAKRRVASQPKPSPTPTPVAPSSWSNVGGGSKPSGGGSAPSSGADGGGAVAFVIVAGLILAAMFGGKSETSPGETPAADRPAGHYLPGMEPHSPTSHAPGWQEGGSKMLPPGHPAASPNPPSHLAAHSPDEVISPSAGVARDALAPAKPGGGEAPSLAARVQNMKTAVAKCKTQFKNDGQGRDPEWVKTVCSCPSPDQETRQILIKMNIGEYGVIKRVAERCEGISSSADGTGYWPEPTWLREIR